MNKDSILKGVDPTRIRAEHQVHPSMHEFSVLAINTGSTSTKIAVYDEQDLRMELSIAHSNEELAKYASVMDELSWRTELVVEALKKENIDVNTLSAIVGRGGLLHPMESGVYEVNEAMIEELRTTPTQHASNLSAIIAARIADPLGIKAYIADPVVVDERDPIAKINGIPEIEKRSIFHALNQKMTARIYSSEVGDEYDNLNLIVAHLGGGISIAAHKKGRVVDSTNALDGDGPISPERSGSIHARGLIDLCYSGKYTKAEAYKLIAGKGGLVALTGTNSVKELDLRAQNGDRVAIEALDAMIYGVAKHIGEMAVVLRGEVDAILLTGGIAHCKRITDGIAQYCQFLAPIEVYAGENELKALALNGIRVLHGECEAKTYK